MSYLTSPLGPIYNYDLPHKLGLRLYPLNNQDQDTVPFISAGYFESESPEKGEGSLRFVPSAAAQKLINEYKKSSGLDLKILPMSKYDMEASPEFGGFYTASDPNLGHSNPKERGVYIRPDDEVDLFLTAHEARHSHDPDIDPSLTNKFLGEQYSNYLKDSYSDLNKSPKAFLSDYMRDFINSTKAEAEANRGAADYLEKIGVNPGSYVKDYMFRGYPASKVETGLGSAAMQNIGRYLGAPMYSQFRPTLMQTPEDSAVAYSVYNPSSEVSRGMLNLALDPEYRSAEDSIRNRARQIIDSKLQGIVNKYQ